MPGCAAAAVHLGTAARLVQGACRMPWGRVVLLPVRLFRCAFFPGPGSKSCSNVFIVDMAPTFTFPIWFTAASRIASATWRGSSWCGGSVGSCAMSFVACCGNGVWTAVGCISVMAPAPDRLPPWRPAPRPQNARPHGWWPIHALQRYRRLGDLAAKLIGALPCAFKCDNATSEPLTMPQKLTSNRRLLSASDTWSRRLFLPSPRRCPSDRCVRSGGSLPAPRALTARGRPRRRRHRSLRRRRR